MPCPNAPACTGKTGSRIQAAKACPLRFGQAFAKTPLRPPSGGPQPVQIRGVVLRLVMECNRAVQLAVDELAYKRLRGLANLVRGTVGDDPALGDEIDIVDDLKGFR